MKKRLLCLLALVAMSGYAQETLTRANGKKIIINNDGTWTYANAAKNTSVTNDCSRYIKTSVNPNSGNTNVIANESLMYTSDGKSGYSAILMNSKDNSTTILVFESLEPKCVNENNLIGVVFTDGTSLRIESNTRQNCEGRSNIYFGGVFDNEDHLKSLTEKNIYSLFIITNGESVIHDFTEDEASIFKNTLNCLANTRTKK